MSPPCNLHRWAQKLAFMFQMMRTIRRWLSKERTHQGMSMVAVHIITHGTKEGILRPAGDYGQGILLADLVGTLCDVQQLRGKPKLFFINACRGGKVSLMPYQLIIPYVQLIIRCSTSLPCYCLKTTKAENTPPHRFLM